MSVLYRGVREGGRRGRTSIEETGTHAYMGPNRARVHYCAGVFHRSLISRQGKLHRLCFCRVQGRCRTLCISPRSPVCLSLISNAFPGVAQTRSAHCVIIKLLCFLLQPSLSFAPSSSSRIKRIVRFRS